MRWWTGALVRQTLLLLLTMSSLSSPFLQSDYDNPSRHLSLQNQHNSHHQHQHHPHHHNHNHPHHLPHHTPPAASDRNSAYVSERSQHAALMMAASDPRIGLRSALIGSGDTCQVDPVRMSIRPPRKYAHICSPTTEISFGCRGACTSYSRIDAWNSTNVLRSCSCCRPTGFGFRLVKMSCGRFSLRTTVKFALGCHCRPCMASVQPVDIQRLRDLLRANAITSIG
ncbi:uncharacterized protein LOC143294164 [Babylonia areolata]|uniref:uncharacterized protein LOC143294164 n=1 Tax=Babylonia areolata TaxID=304850 RepID=UPI003FD53B9E